MQKCKKKGNFARFDIKSTQIGKQTTQKLNDKSMKKALNKLTAPKSVMPERIIQFGEGNFLRAFVDWIVWNMDAKTNFNGSWYNPLTKVW